MAQDPLEVIREEQASPATSQLLHQGELEENPSVLDDSDAKSLKSVNLHLLSINKEETCCACVCERKPKEQDGKAQDAMIEKLLAEKEQKLLEDFETRLKKEVSDLTDRFDFILRNEQLRASYMLTAAGRERQEKIMALQTQLQCKNLAGLLYVMCNERRKCRMQKVQIVEDFTRYVTYLHEVLTEAQDLILNLSRGYKTAARVDREWRDKMTSVMTEFQNFVYHFAGGTPESTQYFFDLPKILESDAPKQDDPDEDPICDCEQEWEDEAPPYREKEWWEGLEHADRPFVVFGDMGDFTPDQRRRTLKCVKAKKTAPRKWKEYIFNHQTLLKSGCPNLSDIKDYYESHLPIPGRLSCTRTSTKDQEDDSKEVGKDVDFTRRATSVDVRGMGSILKMITQTGIIHSETKATLLGAKDSMEIASTTRLKEKSRQSMPEPNKVVLNVGSRKPSYFDEAGYYADKEARDAAILESVPVQVKSDSSKMVQAEDEISTTGYDQLAKHHTDSMEIIENHVPEKDHKINERICPMEECKRMQMDSFVRALPFYMKTNPFTHFEQTYDKYETCTPEQLDIIKSRIDERKRRNRVAQDRFDDRSPRNEWVSEAPGVGVQTSDLSLMLPACLCRDPNVTPASSAGRIFDIQDLIPVKQKLNEITQHCFFDDEIDFDRFKVLGMGSTSSVRTPVAKSDVVTPDFTRTRLEEIKGILKKHPSLCEIFQANTRC